MQKFQADVQLLFGRWADDGVQGLKDFAFQDKRYHRKPSMRLLSESMTEDESVSRALNVLVGVLERLQGSAHSPPSRQAFPGAGGNDKFFAPALLDLVRDDDGNWVRPLWHPDDFWACGRPPKLLPRGEGMEAETLACVVPASADTDDTTPAPSPVMDDDAAAVTVDGPGAPADDQEASDPGPPAAELPTPLSPDAEPETKPDSAGQGKAGTTTSTSVYYCREMLKSHTAGAPGYALFSNGNVTGTPCVPHPMAPDQCAPFPAGRFSSCPLGDECKPLCSDSERFWRPAPYVCGHKGMVCSEACLRVMMAKPRVCPRRCPDATTTRLHEVFKDGARSKRKPRAHHIARLMRSKSRKQVPEDSEDEEATFGGGESESDDDEPPPPPYPGPPPEGRKPTMALTRAEAKERLANLAK